MREHHLISHLKEAGEGGEVVAQKWPLTTCSEANNAKHQPKVSLIIISHSATTEDLLCQLIKRNINGLETGFHLKLPG